jgi:sugar phosphate permease
MTTPIAGPDPISGASVEPSGGPSGGASPGRPGWVVLAALVAGYIGIYLSRKNLGVAVPLLQDALGATKEEVGRIASAGALAYAAGKLILGPVVDRIGGRAGFLLSMAAVALFGAAGAFVPGLALLIVVYGLNRFAGAAGWGAMLKLVPTWFGASRAATVIGFMSLSYVAGGIAATLLARQIVAAGGGWRAVMGLPSIATVVIAIPCIFLVRRGPLAETAELGSGSPRPRSGVADYISLFRKPQFLVVCALSFTITLMRESFTTWSIDFLRTIHATRSINTASLQSIGFDIAGGVAILVSGAAYDRVAPSRRRFLISGTLAVLAGVLVILPSAAASSPAAGVALMGLVGLLVYGPYSLLAGVLAVESGGAKLAATSAGIIDGIGYVAATLAGSTLGYLLDVGGYSLGFRALAAVTAAAAAIALGLRGTSR